MSFPERASRDELRPSQVPRPSAAATGAAVVESPMIAFPELTPALLPIAGMLGFSVPEVADGDPVLPPAVWPALRRYRTSLPAGSWRRLGTADLWDAHTREMAHFGACRERAAGTEDASSTPGARGAAPELEGSGARAPDGDSGGPSLLALKHELARRLSSPCQLCTVRCGARREAGEVGACGAGASAATRVYRVRELVCEEAFLASGWAIDPSGCNANCVFCHSARGTSARSGVLTPAARAAADVDAQKHVKHLNVVGGESTVHVPWVFEVLLALARTDLPLVLTTNGTATPETLAVLRGVVSAYLVSARLGDSCAATLGDAGMSAPLATIHTLAAQPEGVTVVRVLPIPGHVECCTSPWIEALDALHAHGGRFWVRLTDAYIPAFRARALAELAHPLTDRERRQARERLARSGLRILETFSWQEHPAPYAMRAAQDSAVEPRSVVA